jgi:hypothetical protein
MPREHWTISVHAVKPVRGVPAGVQLQDPIAPRMHTHEVRNIVDELMDDEPVALGVVVVLRDL